MMPPPLLPAWFPWIRFRLIVTLPVPTLRAVAGAPAGTASPMRRIPPPSVNDSFRRITLLSITTLSLRPRCRIPPPTAALKLPQRKFWVIWRPSEPLKMPMPPPPLAAPFWSTWLWWIRMSVFSLLLNVVAPATGFPAASVRTIEGVPRRMPPPKNPWLLWILLLLTTRFWTYPLMSMPLPCTAPVNRKPSIRDGFVRNRTLSDRTRIPAPCSRKKSARSPGTTRTVPAATRALTFAIQAACAAGSKKPALIAVAQGPYPWSRSGFQRIRFSL